jgi:hypothetical protein
MTSSLECSTLPLVIPVGRRGNARFLSRFNVFQFGDRMSEGFAHPCEVSGVCSPRFPADKGKLVRLCLDITPGSWDCGERKDGDNT